MPPDIDPPRHGRTNAMMGIAAISPVRFSGAEKAAVGLCEITRAARKDGEEGNWVSVEVKPIEPLPTPVTLAAMKAEPTLAGMAMLRQSRLSVSPVEEAEWAVVMGMGNLSA